VTTQEVARIPASAFADAAGTVVPAASLTTPQVRSLARFLQDGVTAFTFWDVAAIEDLIRRASIELRVPATATSHATERVGHETSAAAAAGTAAPNLAAGSSPVLTQAFLSKAAADPALVLYRKGEASKYFTVVLSGRVRITAGAENFASDLRTMARLGEAALFDRSIATTPNFVPEFAAFVIEPARILRISRDEYIAAFERARNRPAAPLVPTAARPAGSSAAGSAGPSAVATPAVPATTRL
jgi:hypothetical protein